MNAVFSKISHLNFLKITNSVLFLVLLVLVLLIGLTCFKVIYPEGDIIEHIYVTFLVSLGDVPYRDFFEHHHPLLWYIWAPFIGLLNRNVEVIGWADYVTFCFFLCGLYFLYRTIVEFLSTRTAALLSLIYALLPNIFLYYVYYKPDNWMLACISIAIYYFLGYFRNYKRYQLVLAYLFLFIGFLFIQKAVFYYPVIAVVSLYTLYKKEMPIKDFFCALILPLLITVGGILYFYFVGGLKEYFYLNFIFNQKMMSYFTAARISEPFYMGKIIIGAGILGSIGLYKFESRYFRILCWIFWIILAQKAFHFSPHIYYWYEAYYFAVPIAVASVIRLANYQKLLLIAVVIETLFYAGFMGYYLYHDVVYKPKHYAPKTYEFILNNTNSCDEFVGFNAPVSLFTKIPQYYWFLQGHIDVFGEKMGMPAVEDINAIIKQRLPKIIWVDRIYERYGEDFENPKIIHQPDMEMIEKYYVPTDFATDIDGFDFDVFQEKKLDYKRGLWLLKYKYRRHNCQYDKKNNRWKYGRN